MLMQLLHHGHVVVWIPVVCQCGVHNISQQINLEPIPLQECVTFSPSNSFLFITMKLGQRVVQDLHIHRCVILNPRALLLSRWAFGLIQLNGNIVMCLELLHQILFGHIGCTTPINTISKFSPILCPMTPFMVTTRGTTTFETKKNKNIKFNVKINNLNEGYPL